MPKETKLIMFRGNSGSGKTSTAKALQKIIGNGTMLISQDVVRREVLYVKDKPNSNTDELLIELVMFGKRKCEITILEGILDTKLYGKLFKKLHKEFNQIYAYYFAIPFDETLKRHKMKNNSHEFGEKEMRRWWNEKDLIKFIPETLITEKFSLGDVVQMVLKEIK
jgi:adenylate kinase family enzyme